jgi:1-acyl-sn-glycerol-3-phosphate acyltransferase
LPVVKDNPRASLKSMNDAVRLLREQGMSVMLFPEGGRSKDGVIQEFIEGAAYIAVKSGMPVIPIAMTGTREVLPMGSLQIMSGVVRLRIGDPILTANLALKDRATLTQTMHDKVADLLSQSASQPQETR